MITTTLPSAVPIRPAMVVPGGGEMGTGHATFFCFSGKHPVENWVPILAHGISKDVIWGTSVPIYVFKAYRIIFFNFVPRIDNPSQR